MQQINISVANKIATGDRSVIVCGNSDYIVNFDFSEEWNAYPIKTMRVRYGSEYQEVVFEGNTCRLPVIQNQLGIEIGVYAGNLNTTTPVFFDCRKSILCGNDIHDDPPEDVYHQLTQLVESGYKGDDGYTPVRGTDYWTEEDKEEIKSYVNGAILGGAW